MNDTAWIPVGDLGKAFQPEANTLAPTADLVGRSLLLNLADGRRLECRFEGADTLMLSGLDDAPNWDRQPCLTTRIRKGIYFVDFLRGAAPIISHSVVLDLNRGVCTLITGCLPTEAEAGLSLLQRAIQGRELTAVATQFVHGAIGVPFSESAPKHESTLELVDRRVEYTYSPTERYEHIYLNPSFYSWHCLLGSEQGLADTDRCHYYKIDELLYLFVWREKIVPTLGVVLLDLDQLKTTGKVFGYRGYDFDGVTNFAVGATVRLLNTTSRA